MNGTTAGAGNILKPAKTVLAKHQTCGRRGVYKIQRVPSFHRTCHKMMMTGIQPGQQEQGGSPQIPDVGPETAATQDRNMELRASRHRTGKSATSENTGQHRTACFSCRAARQRCDRRIPW